jgi:hypothetical protein
MPDNESRNLLYRPPKYKPPISSLCASPTLVTFDPGGTTGYSVMQIHPESLVDPDVKILNNIQFHSHGQIDCGSTKGNAGDSPARAATEIMTEDAGRRVNGTKLEMSDMFLNGDFGSIGGGDSLGISTFGESAGVSEMLYVVDMWPGAATLFEDFILRTSNMDRDVLSAVRVTAAAEFGLWMMGRISLPRQSPSLAKTTATDERLKAWGLYQRSGGMRHARDADRHAITFYRRCTQGPKGQALRELAWPHIYGIVRTKDKEVTGPYWQPQKKRGKISTSGKS